MRTVFPALPARRHLTRLLADLAVIIAMSAALLYPGHKSTAYRARAAEAACASSFPAFLISFCPVDKFRLLLYNNPAAQPGPWRALYLYAAAGVMPTGGASVSARCK